MRWGGVGLFNGRLGMGRSVGWFPNWGFLHGVCVCVYVRACVKRGLRRFWFMLGVVIVAAAAKKRGGKKRPGKKRIGKKRAGKKR